MVGRYYSTVQIASFITGVNPFKIEVVQYNEKKEAKVLFKSYIFIDMQNNYLKIP